MLIILIAWPVAAQQPATTTPRNPADQQWKTTILPIIENACLDCHTGDDAAGSLDLERFETVDQVVARRRLWQKIATRVRDHQMPPDDGPELDDALRARFLNWTDQVLPGIPCAHQHHAGTVTIRRLTRYEYANTVRDLLGVEYAVTETFPVDEVGYGFDNIGDVLSVSPLLMEKYLTAAEAISELVIRDPLKNRLSQVVPASEFGDVRGGRLAGGFYYLSTNGTITSEVRTPVAGRYKIEVTAFGSQAGDELPGMAVSVNGKVIREVQVRPERVGEAETFAFQTILSGGRNRIGVSFTNDFYDPENPDRRRRDRNLAVVEIGVSGPVVPPPPSRAEQEFLIATPSASQSPLECATQIINRHASRAFRRQVYQTERQKLLELFQLGLDNGESFHGAMQLVIQALLVSPHFLYKIEQPAPDDGSLRWLSDYELATALSYFLWSSLPDDPLFRTATDGRLAEPAVLEAEVRRMLRDPRATALIDNFVAQWLQLRVLDQVDPDPELYPQFTDHLRNSMQQETRLLLADVIKNDAPLTTLLTADYTYVNKALARHYGWSTRGLREQRFSKVSLDGKPRRGLLSHASILTLTSNPTRTSPVKRGKWVLENLLADPPPPALPDVPQLDSQKELSGTLRERMEQHRADPNCATCHYKMDSLGFALENYDLFGRYREMDEGQVIDAAGTLPGGLRFASAAELQAIIAKTRRQAFVRCIVEKLFVYALGRGPQATDDCVIDAIAREASDHNQRISDIVLAIVTSEAFRARSRPPVLVQEKSNQ